MERTTAPELMQTPFRGPALSRDERQTEVNGLFNRIEPRHELMKDLMGFGPHRLWKKTVAPRALARAGGVPGVVVDHAQGARDLAFALRRRLLGDKIVAMDAAPGMLEVVRARGAGAREPAGDFEGLCRRFLGPCRFGQEASGGQPCNPIAVADHDLSAKVSARSVWKVIRQRHRVIPCLNTR